MKNYIAEKTQENYKPGNQINEFLPNFHYRPYVIAKMCELDSPHMKKFLKNKPELLNKAKLSITPSTVRSLSTEKIISQLAERSIQYNQDIFLKNCKNNESAWDVADVLWPEQSYSSSMDTSDFVGISACILWERLYSEGLLPKASFEMVDDWIEEGYQHVPNEPVLACDIWLKAWDGLKSLFDLENLSILSLDKKLNGSQHFFNWCQDFEMEIHNAVIADKKYIGVGISYLSEFLDYFSSDNHQKIVKNIKNTLLELQTLSGEH